MWDSTIKATLDAVRRKMNTLFSHREPHNLGRKRHRTPDNSLSGNSERNHSKEKKGLRKAYYIGLAKKLIQVFPKDMMEKPTQINFLANPTDRRLAVVPAVKNLPTNIGDRRDTGSIPGLGRFLGGGHGNPVQYSCLGNPMGRGAWQATVHGVAKESSTT